MTKKRCCLEVDSSPAVQQGKGSHHEVVVGADARPECRQHSLRSMAHGHKECPPPNVPPVGVYSNHGCHDVSMDHFECCSTVTGPWHTERQACHGS